MAVPAAGSQLIAPISSRIHDARMSNPKFFRVVVIAKQYIGGFLIFLRSNPPKFFLLFWSSLKADLFPRTEGPRPAVSPGRRLLSCGVLLVLGLATYWAARLAWADHLSRGSDLTSRQRAVRLFPSATLYERLAEKREESGGDPLPDLQRAAELDPENAERRLRLGLQAELAGKLDLAERSLLQAAALSRIYQPRYLLAQYYFRRQNADCFWRWSREAFGKSYGDVGPLLDLCWRMRPDAEWLARLAPEGQPGIAGQFLLFLVNRRQAPAVRSLAVRLARAARREDLPVLLEYCNRCLYESLGEPATDVWNTLCRRRLLPDRALDPVHGESLTNSGFEHPPTGTGFDWRMAEVPWMRVVPFQGGVELVLAGNQPERCLLASQYVPVLTGARYRLRLNLPSGPPREGLTWIVQTAAGKPVETEPGVGHSLTFAATAGVLRLSLFYVRPLGTIRFAGTIALSGAKLEMEN